MAGGIIQLVAYGVEDIYLSGDPQITFFKVVYRRHTNFAIESVIQSFNSGSKPDFGETVTCTISRLGDLLGQLFLCIELPSIPKFIDSSTGEIDTVKKFAWVKYLGYALVKEVTIEIGGKVIDKHYGEWLYIWSQVSNKKKEGLSKMIGNIPEIYNFSSSKNSYRLYIPLEFWFCKHNGLALPLIALSSSDVKLNITFRKLEECYRIGPTHSIEIEEDICPFVENDFIEQESDNKKIYGMVIGHDYLQKNYIILKFKIRVQRKSILQAIPKYLIV